MGPLGGARWRQRRTPTRHCRAHKAALAPLTTLCPPPPSQLLLALAEAAGVRSKIDAMFGGQHINATEDRAVLHVALRAPRDAVIEDAGKNVVPEVWEVLDRIKAFSGGWVSG